MTLAAPSARKLRSASFGRMGMGAIHPEQGLLTSILIQMIGVVLLLKEEFAKKQLHAGSW